jgi:hypothetical protein
VVRFDDEHRHLEIDPYKLDRLPDKAPSQKKSDLAWDGRVTALFVLFDVSHGCSLLYVYFIRGSVSSRA